MFTVLILIQANIEFLNLYKSAFNAMILKLISCGVALTKLS